MEYTPVYKDNVCYARTTYGCKDEFGVIHPIRYNRTAVFKSENNEVVKTLLRFLKPIYMNRAQTVFIQPVSKGKFYERKHDDEIKVTKIYRPHEDLVS